MLPPHMEFASMKRKGRVKIAVIIGVGNLNFISFIERNVVNGSENIPKTVTILKAICKGMT